MCLPSIYTEEFKLTVRKNTKIFPKNNFFLLSLTPYSHPVAIAFVDSFSKLT